jgi:hypothetical protein
MVQFDAVAFSGTGGLTFASPADGVYATPAAAATVTATTAP